MGKLHIALSRLNKLLHLAPKHAEGHAMYAVCLYQMQLVQRANSNTAKDDNGNTHSTPTQSNNAVIEEHFNISLALDKHHAQNRIFYCLYLFDCGGTRQEEAIKHLREFSNANEGNHYCRFILAFLQYQLKRYQDAVQHFHTCCQQVPENWQYYAYCQFDMGADVHSSKRNILKALELFRLEKRKYEMEMKDVSAMMMSDNSGANEEDDFATTKTMHTSEMPKSKASEHDNLKKTHKNGKQDKSCNGTTTTPVTTKTTTTSIHHSSTTVTHLPSSPKANVGMDNETKEHDTQHSNNSSSSLVRANKKRKISYPCDCNLFRDAVLPDLFIPKAQQYRIIEVELCEKAATILNKLNLWKEAKEQIEVALELCPNHIEAVFRYASILGNLKDYDNATVQYQKLFRMDPNHGRAFNNYGVMMMERDKFEEAKESFEKAERALGSKMRKQIQNNLAVLGRRMMSSHDTLNTGSGSKDQLKTCINRITV
ncbi:putative fimbrial biogenesis and twitching motility protein [Reticulomyxa filosa]|uniref:Putative fimbrial biogenesis and twitching motility protein n=1 Tax=Reticulomyxa filosa TaxID=46433 RepID=X6ML56_RETFI|nr:putative fimbrial biogenesis and twitching motility protein [Reticulomyxa filosa]|eukprot:ETO14748.1 putative fimbrial biogenesis and twitching motility protein [Reticulomyxa filosa]